MDDIPKGVILVLLIITVLISVLGTWTVLDQVTNTNVRYVVADRPESTAHIGIKVINPPSPKVPTKVDAGADIGITVENPPSGGI